MAEKIKIGFVGCGDISGIYLKNLTELYQEVEILGVCDLVREKAQKLSLIHIYPGGAGVQRVLHAPGLHLHLAVLSAGDV